VASGRQYASVKRLFAPVADKILFIAENGALVFYKDKRLFMENIPADSLAVALEAVRKEDHACPLLCCADYSYAEDDYPPFDAECTKHYPHFKRIQRLEDAPEINSVCKIAVFDDRGSADHAGKSLAAALPSFRVIASGQVWADISMKETNKGRALTFAQSYFGLKREECMAFGDYMNDLELLLACGHAYVPENGLPALKERIGNVIPSNAEKGVIQKIKELLKGNE
ncbi:MAG: HAD hydrolase family protein, partial [Clostridia bacterium]|nr:HAD hydrolase family protein [Clostridia bacterium]